MVQEFKERANGTNLFKVPVSPKRLEDDSQDACEQAFICPDSRADLAAPEKSSGVSMQDTSFFAADFKREMEQQAVVSDSARSKLLSLTQMERQLLLNRLEAE